MLISRSAGYHGTHGFGTVIAGISANREGFGPLSTAEVVAHDSLGEMRAAIERLGPERVAAVREVRGGVGTLAAVALEDDVLAADPNAVASLDAAAQQAGVLVQPLSGAIAVSPPLTAGSEHFTLIAEALGDGLPLQPGVRGRRTLEPIGILSRSQKRLNLITG